VLKFSKLVAPLGLGRRRNNGRVFIKLQRNHCGVNGRFERATPRL